MQFALVDDAVEFRELTRGLLADEARHNLMRGILNTVVAEPDAYADRRFMVVDDEGETVACALMTMPYRLILADVTGDEPLRTLLEGAISSGLDIPGLIGNRPTIDRAVEMWQELTGVIAELSMSQAVYFLDEVVPPPRPPGRPRIATAEDLELIAQWHSEFIAEALPDEPSDETHLRRRLASRLRDGGSSKIWLWELSGEPVSMSSNTSPTGTGIRINAVYTPPSQRGNGYATALVAAQSQALLDDGFSFCFLFADLANPTSNRIYERIGYRRVAEAASYNFSRVP